MTKKEKLQAIIDSDASEEVKEIAKKELDKLESKKSNSMKKNPILPVSKDYEENDADKILENLKKKKATRKSSAKKSSKSKDVQNFRAFEISYLGATNNSGSRVKIKDLRFKVSKIISYDHSFNSTYEIAIDFLRKKGIEPIGKAEAGDAYLVFTDDFENQIK